MEEKGLLSYVKKVIHSLVVSEPLRMTVEKLKRDYASEEGTAVPFSKLGFRDIESFLRSIPDTITLIGSGPMAGVLAKTHANSAHIQNLVQSQKKPSIKARIRNKSKPRFWYPSERSDLVFVNEHSHANNNRFNNNSYNNAYQNNNRQTYSRNGSNNISRHIYGQHSNRASQPMAGRQQNVAAQTNSMINSFSKFKIHSIDLDTSSDEQTDFEIYVPDRDKHPVINDINREIPVETQSYPEYVSSDEGCGEDAIPMYAVDNTILNYKHAKNAHNVGVTQVENYEVAKVEPAQRDEPVFDNYSSDEGCEEEAIPIYAVDECVMSVDYPINAVRIDQTLPVRDTQKLKLENREEVQLVTISSPHSFYFWLHDDDLDDYKGMYFNMQNFYNSIDLNKFCIPLYFIMIGHLGAMHYKETTWQRVQVLNIKTDDRKNIEVELVDTGERLWICHMDLMFLAKEFARLPPQCWKGRLACVAPRQGPSFSAHASNYFFDLVCFRKLFAKFEKINEEDNTAYMVLVDPESKSLAKNINLALIDSGYVRRCYKP